MRKTSILVATALILGLGKNVYAAEQETFKDKAGTVPGSILYKADRKIEDLRLAFTKEVEKKAQIIEELNNERLAESEVMLEDKNIEQAEKLIKEIMANQDKLMELIADIEKLGDLNLNENTTKFIEELEKIKEMLPEEMQKNIEKVIKKQKLKEDFIEKQKDMKDKIKDTKDEIKEIEEEIKKMEKEGKDTTELKNKLEKHKNALGALEKEYETIKENTNNSNNNIDKDEDKDDNEEEDDGEEEDEKDLDDEKDEEDDEDDKDEHKNNQQDKVDKEENKGENKPNNDKKKEDVVVKDKEQKKDNKKEESVNKSESNNKNNKKDNSNKNNHDEDDDDNEDDDDHDEDDD